ncbi:hypothetical protein KQX54_004898 [Cotesia glomerata]|uniref:RING-type domain-containing protein n=1 Tax=Cotesia glomerata TaxID=32391 RepID=A0AAV7HW33_COTGL|nr:hypothetical protein KQX54_004898 [Cotesia glomerata]
MNCSCVICWVRLQATHNIIATDCGHIFHNKCLNEWIERSPTCPECRKDVNSTQIRRLYINFTNDDTIQDDPAVLQEQIDKLQYLTRFQESQIQTLTTQKKNYELRINALDRDLITQAKEVRKLDVVVFALEDQLKGHKAACDERKYYLEQTVKLKGELDSCRNFLSLEQTAAEHYKSMALKHEMTISQNNARIDKLQEQLALSEAKYMTKLQEAESLQHMLARAKTPVTTSTINNDSILMSTLPDLDDIRLDQSPSRSEPAFPFNLVIKSRENKENEPMHNSNMFSFFKRKSSTPEYGQPNKRLMVIILLLFCFEKNFA